MSEGNNQHSHHWKSNISLLSGNNIAAAANYQNILKIANAGAPSSVIHQHHSAHSMNDEHLIPAHSLHLNHMRSPCSSSSLYSPGSGASSSSGVGIPSQIPRAHQHSVPTPLQPMSVYVEQHQHQQSQQHQSPHHIDVYSQLGMQRIGQMFKANMTANNNNSNCNNKNAKSQGYDAGIKLEQNMNNVKQLVESAIGMEAKQQIMHILEKISLLQPPERLLLYLRMPSSTSETDPLRQPQNPLGTRSEISFTINWVRSHLEHDPNVSIPKQDVYDDYVSYCGREDVKPLSTADFGKVMKQIFPSIRPRRLGTRGNSRYCYAAMRKTTKLECPQLPNLNDTRNTTKSSTGRTMSGSDGGNDDADNDSNDFVGSGTSASLKIIKIWAESLLNVDFKNIDELAEHISTNFMNETTKTISNSSRALLQKKLLQRKVKGRKKKAVLTNDSLIAGGKKRRKKKLKKLSRSNSEQSVDNEANIYDSAGSVSTTIEPNVPDEILIKQERRSHSSANNDLSPPGQQSMPINLTNEHGKVKNEHALSAYGSGVDEEMHDYSNPVCKIEVEDSSEIEQTVYCKKKLRAQEAKGFSVPMSSPKMQPTSPSTPDVKNYAQKLSPSSMLMRPPMCDSAGMGAPTDLSAGNDGFPISASTMNTLQLPVKRNSFSSSSGRGKKLRFFKHASVAGMNETKVEDIATDIIIPRERVVSICNMDKDALDDYLTEDHGDSQEQEAELLQYFQPPDKHGNSTTTTIQSTSASATAPATTSTNDAAAVATTTSAYPLLENYQLHQNAGLDTAANSQIAHGIQQEQIPHNKQDQIDELRQYLQQNLHHPTSTNANSDDRTVTSSSQIGPVQLPFNEHSEWKSSNDITPTTLVHPSPPYPDASVVSSASISKRKLAMQQVSPQLMRSASATSTVIQGQSQQSPNSRCKNFSFVPISPGPQSPRVLSHTQTNNMHNTHGRNTFRSPAVRKIANKDLTSCLKSLQDPSISAYENAVSASAPASPSMTPHHFQFNNTMVPFNTANTMQMGMNQQSPQQQQQQQPHQHTASCSVSGCPVLESRSQSVPLHCQSPAFNQPISNTAYNSVCNSVAQTPVPSEYADFNEENLLDMLAESAEDQNIKMETDELINNELNSHNLRGHVSRSVPSTPLPTIHGYNRLNAIPAFNTTTNSQTIIRNTANTQMVAGAGKHSFDMSKSVPTTPNALIGSNTPFRYSPEHHRDFLINGNTIDTAKNQFFSIGMQQQQQQHSQHDNSPTSQHTSPQSQHSIIQQQQAQQQLVSSTQSNSQILLSTSSQPLDDLTNYSDVNDPIIESSNLMNNL